jgi:hypothetical protein
MRHNTATQNVEERTYEQHELENQRLAEVEMWEKEEKNVWIGSRGRKA